MGKPGLTTRAKRELRRASRERVEAYFADFPRHERVAKWIRVGNRYRADCADRYRRDAAKHTVDHGDLRDYVAASGPAHVIDGWALLGRAIDSALRRDGYSAVHFAYYAELRAAVCLLACEGIGIFNRKHAIVNRRNTAPLRQTVGTHHIAYLGLQHWAALSRASGLLEDLVQPSGIPLSQWLHACHASVPARAIGQKWLRCWGLDLAIVREDQDLRNLASYRPSCFRLAGPLATSDVVDFVQQLWSLFEPSSGGGFPTIEGHLLRRALRAGNVQSPAAADIMNLGMAEQEAKSWAGVLSRGDESLPLVEAERRTPIENSRCHLQVISRAALLLYVSTRAAGRLLRKAGYAEETLAFWWRSFGEARGLWAASSPPGNPTELWADMEAALADLRALDSASNSFRELRRNGAAAISELGAWEAVAIWGLVP